MSYSKKVEGKLGDKDSTSPCGGLFVEANIHNEESDEAHDHLPAAVIDGGVKKEESCMSPTWRSDISTGPPQIIFEDEHLEKAEAENSAEYLSPTEPVMPRYQQPLVDASPSSNAGRTTTPALMIKAINHPQLESSNRSTTEAGRKRTRSSSRKPDPRSSLFKMLKRDEYYYF